MTLGCRPDERRYAFVISHVDKVRIRGEYSLHIG